MTRYVGGGYYNRPGAVVTEYVRDYYPGPYYDGYYYDGPYYDGGYYYGGPAVVENVRYVDRPHRHYKPYRGYGGRYHRDGHNYRRGGHSWRK